MFANSPESNRIDDDESSLDLEAGTGRNDTAGETNDADPLQFLRTLVNSDGLKPSTKATFE